MRPSCTSVATEDTIIAALGEAFYRIVPRDFTTYCVHVSHVAKQVLAEFGVAARVLPCQLWHASPTDNHVMGFLGVDAKQGKWDGHVACATESNIFDAAVRGLRLNTGHPLPAIAGAPIFDAPTHVIARLVLDGERQLWWYDAPAGADLSIPQVSERRVRDHVAALVPLVEERLVSHRPSATPCERPERFAPLA